MGLSEEVEAEYKEAYACFAQDKQGEDKGELSEATFVAFVSGPNHTGAYISLVVFLPEHNTHNMPLSLSTILFYAKFQAT
jgi:hypothetical protein